MHLKSEFNSTSEFRKSNPKDYGILKKRGLIKNLCEIYGWEYRESKPPNYWTKDKVIQEIKDKEIDSISKWKKVSMASLRAAQRLDIYHEVSKGMKRGVNKTKKPKPRGYWNKERVLKDAKNYNYPSDWKRNNEGALKAARRLGIYEEATAHMYKRKQINWNKNKIIKNAQKYNSIKDWRRYSYRAYKAAHYYNCVEEATKHMRDKSK